MRAMCEPGVERHLLDGAEGGRSQTLHHLGHPDPELGSIMVSGIFHNYPEP